MATRRVRDGVVFGVAALVVVLLVLLVTSGSGAKHRLWVTVPDATGMLTGEPVRDAGITVGNVTYLNTIDGGREARVGLTLDSQAWPVQRGTIFRLRWGGTVSYVNDYIDLLRPAHGGADYADGATLPERAFTVPVQFDTLIDDFTPGVRRDTQSLLNHGGAAFQQAETPLKKTLDQTPAALVQANALLEDLNQNSAQLKNTISAAGSVVNAFETSQPTVEDLVGGAGQTLAAIADRAGALETTLGRAPGTFANIDVTLDQADRTLDLAQQLTGQIAPGVSELKSTVTPLDQLLENVMSVAPDARATLTTLTDRAPQITGLVNKLDALMPAINYTATHSNTSLDCIRPYTPDIVALTTNWGRFISSTDGTDYYARILPSAIISAPTNAEPGTPAEAISGDPGLQDTFLRAPGQAADEPWYQPQCGITASSLNPSNDPEASSTDDTPLPAVNHPGNSR